MASIEHRADGSLVVEERPTRERAFGIVAVAGVTLLGLTIARPSPLGLAVCGVALVGALAIVVLPQAAVFVFDHPRRTLVWHRRNLLRAREGEVPFAVIREVKVEAGGTNEDQRADCIIYLVTSAGRLPLANAYRNCDAQHVVADAIRAVLLAP